ncbi:MAG: hypothetical protein SGCHY_000414 [Lobulomycetales sp.]
MDARAILRAFDFPGEIMSSLRQRRPLGPKDSGDAPLEPQETDSDHYSYPDSKLKSSQRSPALLPLQIVAVTDWITPLVLTLLAFFTRLYLISRNNHVVWDEAHFGKFASYYLKREFYFDVHPPLGKILLGFSGALAGYNGSFSFKSDLALLTISRFILLDSMLLFFTATSAFCLYDACFSRHLIMASVSFRNFQKIAPFSDGWWLWLFLTGVSIGCVTSVKWVGLFAIALVGLNTLQDLWDMFGDLKMPKAVYLKHWIARIVFLIIVPVSIYLFSFWLHFAILDHTGPGDAHLSSLFQAGLRGNVFDKGPLELAYGSVVSLKNNGYGGGLLHSHVQKFPTGSEQQQVTCYHHKDSNNEWIVHHAWQKFLPEDRAKDFHENDPSKPEMVKDGDLIRLLHKSTGRNLHSHNIEAPVTKKENEVSCYGNATFGDLNDVWRVEVVPDGWIAPTAASRIRSLSTRFRLRHRATGCLLRSHSVNLPQWGFKQAEVVCQKVRPDNSSSGNMWNVELHVNNELPPAGANEYRSSFLKDVLDLNVAMWNSNNALTPDPDREPNNLVSQPWQWPVLHTGLRMASWSDEKVKYFLMGHPLIWWGSSLSVIGILLVVAYYMVQNKRGIVMFSSQGVWDDFVFGTQVSVGGWALHYLPFWLMGRVCYIHHYFPAVYFAIIGMSFLLDHIVDRMFPLAERSTGGNAQEDESWRIDRTPKRSWMHSVVLGLVLAVITSVFVYFSPFSFGFTGNSSELNGRRWLSSWKF